MTFHYMTKLRNWEYGPVCIRNRMPKDYWVVSDLTHIICKHIINVLLPPTALNEVKINKIMYCVLLFIIIAIRQINDILLYYAKRNFSTLENKFLFTLHLLSTIYSHFYSCWILLLESGKCSWWQEFNKGFGCCYLLTLMKDVDFYRRRILLTTARSIKRLLFVLMLLHHRILSYRLGRTSQESYVRYRSTVCNVLYIYNSTTTDFLTLYKKGMSKCSFKNCTMCVALLATNSGQF